MNESEPLMLALPVISLSLESFLYPLIKILLYFGILKACIPYRINFLAYF